MAKEKEGVAGEDGTQTQGVAEDFRDESLVLKHCNEITVSYVTFPDRSSKQIVHYVPCHAYLSREVVPNIVWPAIGSRQVGKLNSANPCNSKQSSKPLTQARVKTQPSPFNCLDIPCSRSWKHSAVMAWSPFGRASVQPALPLTSPTFPSTETSISPTTPEFSQWPGRVTNSLSRTSPASLDVSLGQR